MSGSLIIIRTFAQCYDIVGIGLLRSASMATSLHTRSELNEVMDFIADRTVKLSRLFGEEVASDRYQRAIATFARVP